MPAVRASQKIYFDHIFTASAQRLRRWSNIAQMLYKCIVLTGIASVVKVIYHPLYSMNNFVTNKSKCPRDGAQVFPYMG